MSDTDTDDTVEMSQAQALTELRRTRISLQSALGRCEIQRDELQHLRDRIFELEAQLALAHGSVAGPPVATETQPQFRHNVPPSAPPHKESQQ